MRKKEEDDEERKSVQKHYGVNEEKADERIRKIMGMLIAAEDVSTVLDTFKGLTDEQKVNMFEFACAFSEVIKMSERRARRESVAEFTRRR